MDRKPQQNPEIQRLIELGTSARGSLSHEAAVLRQRFDLPSRLRRSLTDHPSAWVMGALGSGLAVSLLFRRQPATAKKHRGFPATLLALALTTARPLAKIWLGDQLKNLLAGYVAAAARQPARSASASKSL